MVKLKSPGECCSFAFYLGLLVVLLGFSSANSFIKFPRSVSQWTNYDIDDGALPRWWVFIILAVLQSQILNGNF